MRFLLIFFLSFRFFSYIFFSCNFVVFFRYFSSLVHLLLIWLPVLNYNSKKNICYYYYYYSKPRRKKQIINWIVEKETRKTLKIYIHVVCTNLYQVVSDTVSVSSFVARSGPIFNAMMNIVQLTVCQFPAILLRTNACLVISKIQKYIIFLHRFHRLIQKKLNQIDSESSSNMIWNTIQMPYICHVCG